MGPMQWGIKGVYLDPQSLPFVSSWFVLMWERNPAKADYTCIKFLKIAVFLIPHLQWKCNRISLQTINLPNCFSVAMKGLRWADRMRQVHKNRRVPLAMSLCTKVGNSTLPHPRGWKTFARLQTLLTWTRSGRARVCAHNWLCTVTQIAAQKNKKVFRLYFCYFTKSISLCHFGGFTRLYISWNASSGFAPNENMKVGGKNKSADFLSYRLPARLKSLFFH